VLARDVLFLKRAPDYARRSAALEANGSAQRAAATTAARVRDEPVVEQGAGPQSGSVPHSGSLGSSSSAWSPSLSPNGAWLAYVSDREGSPRVWLHDRQHNQQLMLSEGPAHVQQVRWSVDGDWLSLLVAPRGSARTQVWVVRPNGNDLHQLGGSPDGTTFMGPWTHRHEWAAYSCSSDEPIDGFVQLENARTRQTKLVATGGQPVVLDFDAKAKLALVRRGARSARTLWVVDLLNDTEYRLLSQFAGGSSESGRLSPDGRFAYVRSNAGREQHALFRIALADPLCFTQPLVERNDADLEEIALSADGRVALLLWNVAGVSEAELMDLVSGRRSALKLPEPVASDSSFAHDGSSLAITLAGPTSPKAVWLFDITLGLWSRISSPQRNSQSRAVEPTLERLRADDGLELTGWLYYPPGPGRGPRPTVIYLHPGPDAQERPAYNPLFHALLARGTAVFAPNVRGSTGFGRSFENADNRAKRFLAIADVAACVRYLIQRGVSVPGRIACAGKGYGGYLTLAALVFHPELFAAGAVVGASADLSAQYLHAEPWLAATAYPKFGHPERDAELLRALSPIHRFDSLRAPLLVVHGAHDSEYPASESERIIVGARAENLPVEQLCFPDEGQDITRLENKELFVQKMVDWFGRWLG